MKNIGFNYSMKFEAPVENTRQKRNGKVIWFNPPYSLSFKANNRKLFLKSCNCRIKQSCPLNRKYLHQCMVYKAEVTTNTTYKEYYGTSEGDFKSRYNNHTQSFRYISRINNTGLSKYLWTLKANRTDYHLKWSVKSYASRYKCGTRRCDLFVTEKMTIALADPKVLLNKRTELISKCLHRNKFILSKFK